MDGEVMAESVKQPKGHLALDMDWMTGVLGVICFGFCLLGSVAMARRVLTGAPVEVRITWQTVFVLLASVWFAIQVRGRAARFVLGLLVISFGSRIILALVHASAQTQVLNAEIMRVVNLVVVAAFYFYIVSWFKDRIRRV
jgi:hypothetical protein